MKKVKGNLFVKILMAFLAAVLLIWIMGLLQFQILKKEMIDQTQDIVYTQIEHSFEQFERDLNKLIRAHLSLLSDTDLSDLFFGGRDQITYANVEQLNRIREKINNIAYSNGNVERISVYINELNIRLNSDGYPSYDDIEEEVFLELSEGYQLLLEQGELYFRSGPGFEVNGNPPYILETKLSLPQLETEMQQSKIADASKCGLIFNGTYVIEEDDLPLQWKRQARTLHENGKEIFCEDNDKYIVIYLYSNIYNLLCFQMIPEEIIMDSTEKYQSLFIMFTALTVLAVLIVAAVIYYLVKKPIDTLVYVCAEVEKENFKVRIEDKSITEFQMVYRAFNRMISKINVLISEVYLNKILTQKAELKLLQLKINPHFLYNSFFILRNSIAAAKYGEAEQFCDMIGRYFRYITKSNDDFSELRDEIEYAKIYTDIQALRFSDRITVLFGEVPEEMQRIKVPKVILQPIIENAFKYGLEEKEDDGVLRISFLREKEWVYISIEDNGEEISMNPEKIERLRETLQKQDMGASGLSNIHARLQIDSEGNSGLEIGQSELGGLKVVIRLWVKK